MPDKPTFDDYLVELLVGMGFANETDARRVHDQNLQSALIGVQKSSTWKTIEAELKEMQSRYLGGRPDLLFYSQKWAGEVTILAKPFASTMLKVYRTNVLFNRKYPEPSHDSIQVDRIYENVDDLLRARVVCRYIDGPRFVCEELKRRCDTDGIVCKYRTLHTEAGYYAWHFYFKVDVSFIEGREVVDRPLWVELQVSTQLAEVITTLTHSLYEARRVGGRGPEGWQWLPNTSDFKSAYLGHGLHLLEGVIQGFRDDVLAPESAANPEARTGIEEN